MKYRVGEGIDVIKTYQHLFETRKSIARHMGSLKYKQALEEVQRHTTHDARRRRIGLNIARTAFQTIREGASYV